MKYDKGEIVNIKIIRQWIEHGLSETEEEETFFLFSSNNPDLNVEWYWSVDDTWKPFKTEPSKIIKKPSSEYKSPGWRTGYPGHKIKAVISYQQDRRELFWESD